jgi:hypothetical protein
LVLALLGAAAPSALASSSLHWDKQRNRVDAEIDSLPLTNLLQQITAATGWQIYLEPDTSHTVSTKFKNLPPGEALPKLFGKLSYALLPAQSNTLARLLVFRTSLHEATELIRLPETNSAKAKPIPNELIVILKPGAKIDDLAKKLGAKVIGRADGLNAYRLQFDDADAAKAAREQLAGNPDVGSVDSNYAIFRPPEGELLSLSSASPFNLKVKAVGDANRLIVGLIDTAIQPQGGPMDAFLLPSLSVAGDANPPAGSPTHGTSMWEALLRGVSSMSDASEGSSVRIQPVDVYGNSASTSTFDVAVGIAKAVNSGAMIINLSLGSAGDTTFLRQVMQSAHDQGVLFFAAAGNEPVTTPTYPAAYPWVVAVTAGDRQGNLTSYANRGDFVDVIAPGSTLITFNGQNYVVSGTSTSTALTTGMAAALKDGSNKSLAQVEAMIRAMLAPKSSAKP